MTTWEYIADLFRPDDRVVICWTDDSDPAFKQRFVTAATACADRFQRFLRFQNAQGSNIYISMNPLRASARSRTKDDILEIRRVYLDIDHDGDAVLNTILATSALPQPNYVLNTSPGKHQLIWNVKGFDRDSAETLMRTLSREFHTDPATVDISRVFRLPGLHNKKYAATFQVTARKLTATVYTPADFPFYQSTATPTAPQKRRASASPPRHSQSERDWAYCCTALWPDPNDEAVIARLINEMERRAQGRRKKPRYYAELTVSEARKYIASERDSSLNSGKK